MRSIDGGGLAIVVVAGGQVADAVAVAKVQADCGAEVLLGCNRAVDAIEAVRRVGDTPRITVVQFDRADHDAMDAALDAFHRGAPRDHRRDHPARLRRRPLHGHARRRRRRRGRRVCRRRTRRCDRGSRGRSAATGRATTRWSTIRASSSWATAATAAATSGATSTARWSSSSSASGADESEVDVAHGRRRQLEWGNQVVRFTNTEAENLPFAAGQAARTLLKERKIPLGQLYLPPNIGEATGARKAMVGFSENITGLHLGKVALITGGSAGIGGQVARLLALAGAKVMIVARREGELATMRARIVRASWGTSAFRASSGGYGRWRTSTFGDLSSLQRAVDETVKAFGRIDYLINNAGVSGAEEMVVDMGLDAWRYTLNANPDLELRADAHGRAGYEGGRGRAIS